MAFAKQACNITKMRDFGSLIALAAANAEVGNHAQALIAAKKALPFSPPSRKQWTIDFIARRQKQVPERDVPSTEKNKQ